MKTIKNYIKENTMLISATLFIVALLVLLVGITDISKMSDYCVDASALIMGAGILLPCAEGIINPQK